MDNEKLSSLLGPSVSRDTLFEVAVGMAKILEFIDERCNFDDEEDDAMVSGILNECKRRIRAERAKGWEEK